jgi:hypothetical protein
MESRLAVQHASVWEGSNAMSILRLELSPSTIARRARGKTWFWRFVAALHESRMRRARDEIARHRHLLPADLELAGDTLNGRSEDQLPFVRRD